MYEDETANAMDDSLTLFDEICNSRWFLATALILFLNKKDLFADRIQKVPLNVCFESYEGDNSYDDSMSFVLTTLVFCLLSCLASRMSMVCLAIEFIKGEFESRNKNPREKQIYTHVCLAVYVFCVCLFVCVCVCVCVVRILYCYGVCVSV